MALSKGVKNVLFVLVGIYLIMVIAFLVKAFTVEESPAANRTDTIPPFIVIVEES